MLYRLIVAVSVLVVGTAAYFGVHYAGTVLADDPPDPDEIGQAVEADRAKPVQDGAVNGISVSPNGGSGASGASGASQASGESPCTDANPPTAAVVSQTGELNFTYPSNWSLLDEWAISCGETAMSLYREMEPAGDALADILVMRWRGATGVELRAAAERVSAVTVIGKKAVHIAPVRTDSGNAVGPDQLVVMEPWGLTAVRAWETDSSPSAQEVYEAISSVSAAAPTPIPASGDEEETE